MKKVMVFVLSLIYVLGLAGCDKSIRYDAADEPGVSETVKEEIASFSAKILEVNDSYLLVEPHAGSMERKSADRIEVPLADKTSWPIPAVGDTVNVFYSGGLQEIYPARITKVHRVEIEIEASDSDAEPDSEIPGATRFIVEIWDRAEEDQLACAEAVEKFYEDETTEYYFSCIKSHHIIVMDNTGKTVDIVTALQEGFATIADLDYYGIGYFTEPKRGIVEPHHSIPDFSFAEDSRIYAEGTPGVKTSGFVNTAEAEINSMNDADERAKNECTIAWDTVRTYLDTAAGIWKVVFSTGTPGGCQSVYLDDHGKTVLIVYGE